MLKSLSPAQSQHLRSISAGVSVIMGHFPRWCSGPAAAAQTQRLETTIMSHLAHKPLVGQHLTVKAHDCSSIHWAAPLRAAGFAVLSWLTHSAARWCWLLAGSSTRLGAWRLSCLLCGPLHMT